MTDPTVGGFGERILAAAPPGFTELPEAARTHLRDCLDGVLERQLTDLRDARLDSLNVMPVWLREPVRTLFESLSRTRDPNK